MGERVQGTVASFQSQRGFGVIQPDEGGETVFVHWKQILSIEKWPQLATGVAVEYTISIDEWGKLIALNVTLPGGGPIGNEQDAIVANRVLSEFTVIGTVAEFKREVGCGYLVCQVDLPFPWPEVLPAGSMIFVSREDLVVVEGCACSLVEGMEVEFRVFQSNNGLQAAEVTSAGGEPIQGLPSSFLSKGKGKGGKGDQNTSTDNSPRFTAPRGWGKGSLTKLNVGAALGVRQPIGAALGVRQPVRLSWPDAGEVPSVQKTIQKSTRWRQSSQSLPQTGRTNPSNGLLTPMSALGRLTGTGSAQLVEDEAFASASLEEQVAALEIMERAMAQAAMAEAAMAQAKVLLLGSARKRELTDKFGNSLLNRNHSKQNRTQFLPPDTFAQAVSQVQAMAQGSKKVKKVPCRFFAEFRCNKGSGCEFSHDPPEMYLPRPLDQKTPLPCTFHEQGKCSRGDACPFAHGQEELIAIEQIKGRGNEGTTHGNSWV